MATEKLVLELDAKVDKAVKDLNDVKKTLKDTDEEATNLSTSFKAVGNAAATVAKAGLAAAAAITAIAVATAKADRTMGNLAVTAKMSKEEFKGLAFAFSQFDVDAKGAADSLNDVSERIGEFTATFAQDGKGSGAFQDFADTMGMTDAAAAAFAMTLEEMKPEDAIIKMVDTMEDAGVSGAKMSWVLKSMSNDLEYTSQLFRDNGSELKNLEGGYKDMSESLQLTTQQSEDIAAMAGSFDLLTAGLGDSASIITSSIAPALEGFFNAVIEIVPTATNAIVDFINRFRSIDDLSSLRELDAQLDIMEEKRATNAALAENTGRSAKAARERVKELDLEILAINERIAEVKAESAEADIARIEAEEGGSFGESFEDKMKKNKKVADDKIKATEKASKAQLKADRDEARADDLLHDGKNANVQNGVSVAMAANALLFGDSKAIEAGLVVAKTGAAVMHQLGSGDPYTAFGRAAAAAAMGAVQLAATLSASKGGGGIAPVSSSPSIASDPEQGQDIAQGGADLSATDASGATGFASNITLEIDGEAIASIVYDNIAKLEQNGVIS